MSLREKAPYHDVEPASHAEDDFDAIEEAVMETARGRWFLDQYAARLRTRETSALLTGMRRLEAAMTANHDALMERISSALASAHPEEPEDMAPQDPGLEARQLQYFEADEDIFEPTPASLAAAVARFAEVAGESDARTRQDAGKRRIVVIRHKPGEDIAVPLADEMPQPA